MSLFYFKITLFYFDLYFRTYLYQLVDKAIFIYFFHLGFSFLFYVLLSLITNVLLEVKVAVSVQIFSKDFQLFMND